MLAGRDALDDEATLRIGDRVFAAAVDAMDVIAIAIGDRLGYYTALDAGPTTPDALAQATGTSRRYCREWLEQQAMSGYLEHRDGVFGLAPGVADVLARRGTSAWLAPMARQVAAAAAHWTRVADGAARGTGLGWADYGPDMFEAQSDMNAAALLESLADHCPTTKNVDVLTEYSRAALAQTITRQFAGPDEFAADSWKVKDLKKREEKTVTSAEVAEASRPTAMITPASGSSGGR